MPTRRGIDGKGQASGAGAHHRQTFNFHRRYDWHFGFVAGARVDQTRGHFADENLIQTGLITANAGIDLISAIALRFGQQFGIGEEGTRHRHHIRIAIRQHIVCDLRIVNAVGRHQRNRHFAFQLARHPAKRRARYGGGDGRNTRFVPADAGINDRCPRRFDRLRQLYGFVKRAAAFHQIDHRQAEYDNKICSDARAYGTHHVDGKAHSARIITTPFVVALVSACRQEFVNQITFGPHDFDAVITGFTR
ncbi:hypothetical protein D3C78_1093970 [compost metagenome]